MMDYDKEYVAGLLNGLIDTCKNAEKGFHEAAEDIRDAQYRTYFHEFATQRGRFATILQGYVRALGFTPDRKGTMAGIVHRGWINFQAAMKRNDDAIILECRRGDDMALKHYAKVLQQDLPPNIRRIVELQYQEIKEVYDR